MAEEESESSRIARDVALKKKKEDVLA